MSSSVELIKHLISRNVPQKPEENSEQMFSDLARVPLATALQHSDSLRNARERRIIAA